MIHVMARITVKPEAAAPARKIMEELVAATRKEAGRLSYELFQQANAAAAPDILTFSKLR